MSNMYAKIKDGSVEKYPYTIGDLKKDNPNTSFTSSISTVTLNSYGVVEVKTENRPSFNETTQYLDLKKVPELVSGVWTLKWEIKDKTQTELDEAKANSQSDIREERLMLLQECDWTGLTDASLSTDMVDKWKTYRQELRDITKQTSFNNAEPSVTWPNQPT